MTAAMPTTAKPNRRTVREFTRVISPNFYYATGGSFIEMRFQSDSAIRNQFIINQTLA